MKKGIVIILALAVFLPVCLAPYHGMAELRSATIINGQLYSSSDKTTYREGNEGEAVREIRKRLIELGYMKDKSNMTRFTSLTTTAVKEFERVNGFGVDGELTPDERQRLMSSSAIYSPVKISYSTLRKNAQNPSDFANRSYTFSCRFHSEENSSGYDMDAFCYMDGKTSRWVVLRIPGYWNMTWTFDGCTYSAPDLLYKDAMTVYIGTIVGAKTYWDEKGNDLVIPIVEVKRLGLYEEYFHR